MERRVLIAEDNEVNRQQMQQVLEADHKVKVDTVSDGMGALEALVNNNYSILLTDLKMPHLDGIRLLEEIQKRRLNVTVIMTTGHGGVDEAVHAMRLGAYDFITKPIDLERLALVIERALRERILQDEVVLLRDQ